MSFDVVFVVMNGSPFLFTSSENPKSTSSSGILPLMTNVQFWQCMLVFGSITWLLLVHWVRIICALSVFHSTYCFISLEIGSGLRSVDS